MDELNIQSLSDLMEVKFPSQKWLVDKIIPDSGLVLMSAAPASFKTWLALEIALCVAENRPLFERLPVSVCNVLIADEEGGDRMLQDRFKKLGVKLDTNPWTDGAIYYLSRVGRQVDDSYIQELIAKCEENDIKLIIFDSLVRFHSARENDAGEMSKVLNLFKTLNDNGITALVLHHNRKSGGLAGGGEMVRGSSDILASCDVHLSVKRHNRKITISQTKNRYMEEIEPFSVELKTIDETRSVFEYLGEENSESELSDELKSIILAQITETPGINKSELARLISQVDEKLSMNRIHTAIKELIKSNEIRTEQGVKNSLCLYLNNNQE